jgi:hypothetical protein
VQRSEVTVKLKKDTQQSCDLVIEQDGDRRHWRRQRPGRLTLRANSGDWVYRAQNQDILFMDEDGDRNAWVMVFGQVPADFLSIFCTDSYDGEGALRTRDLDEILWTIYPQGCA